MLTAIINGKAASVSWGNDQDIRWKELFRIREDLLTAAFFGRLPYLSDEAQVSVLEIIINDRAAAGPVEEVYFWPKMRCLENGKFRRVEPDVLIKCQRATIIIEVKLPPESGSKGAAYAQCPEQWERELDALEHELRNKESPKPVFFVALGRTEPVDKFVFPANFYKKYHFELNFSVIKWRTIYEKILKLEPSLKSDRAVVADWRKAFGLFGLLPPPRDLASLAVLWGNFDASKAMAIMAAWAEPIQSPFDRLAGFAKTFKGDLKWL